MSSLVELLPQSNAATDSVTHQLNSQCRHVDRFGDQFADGVVRADEVIRQMRVQALHTNASAPDSAPGLHGFDAHGGDPASFGVGVVGRSKTDWIDHRFESMDPSIALESTDRGVKFGIDQPEQRRHRRRISQVRLVFDDHWSTVETSSNDRTASRQGTADQGL